MAIIDVQNLHFEYPQVEAIKEVSFQIEEGTVTALVGPNGAGKTTLMNCLVSLLIPQQGSVTIDGRSVFDNPREAHQSIGYLPDFYGVYEDLSVDQCLRYTAMARGLPAWRIDKAVRNAAIRMEIFDLMNMKAAYLSHGQSQRLAIAQAIIHRPKVLFLDEPASGLDPEARHHLSQLIVKMAKAGMTVLVSSHILEELEEYCTHVMMIRDGTVVEHSELKSAKMEAATHRLLEIKLAAEVDDLAAKLSALQNVKDVVVEDAIATFEFTGDETAQQTLLKQLVTSGLPISAFSPRNMRLQDSYLRKMSRS